VGAGGGSIARVDPAGALRVGPESAGADPGPVCYGRGGTEVTVTDAHVWLGRLPADAFLGGSRRLDREAVRGPLEDLAGAMGSEPERAAEGVIEVANATMERALRVISVERGVDPAGYHIMAFGGAAGLHAVELAERLGARGVLVPPDPGLASAWGMLAAPVVRDRTRTVLVASDAEGAEAGTRELLDEMVAEAAEEPAREGFARETLVVRREVDARYRGQSWELTVPARAWAEGFHRAHEARYGYRRPGTPVEAVTLRARVEAPGLAPPSGSPPVEPGSAGPDAVSLRWRGQEVEARCLWRSALADGRGVRGPALILDYSSTVWVPPDWEAAPVRGGILRLTPVASGDPGAG
jgi:N-methylhydantoinase A